MFRKVRPRDDLRALAGLKRHRGEGVPGRSSADRLTATPSTPWHSGVAPPDTHRGPQRPHEYIIDGGPRLRTFLGFGLPGQTACTDGRAIH